jgi:hypothetical protein
MKAALIEVMAPSGWIMLGAAVAMLIALWLVLSSSYTLVLQSPALKLELAPRSPSPSAPNSATGQLCNQQADKLPLPRGSGTLESPR